MYSAKPKIESNTEPGKTEPRTVAVEGGVSFFRSSTRLRARLASPTKPSGPLPSVSRMVFRVGKKARAPWKARADRIGGHNPMSAAGRWMLQEPNICSSQVVPYEEQKNPPHFGTAGDQAITERGGTGFARCTKQFHRVRYLGRRLITA